MKRFILVSLLVALFLCLAPNCGSSGEEAIQSPIPPGQMSAKEAKEALDDYLRSQIRAVSDNLQRYVLADYLSEAKSHWEVHTREMGQFYWEITGMGYDGLKLNDSGLWYVYDVTGMVEPQNSDSRGLLTLIQSL